MKSDIRHLVIRGCEVTLHFSHMKESNRIPENVERMLLEIGLPEYTPQDQPTEKTA